MGRACRATGAATRPRLIGNTAAMLRLCRQVVALAARRCTVLLNGESGTGKELVARLIHARSDRRGGPFIPVDCTGLRDTLFESQLFGHTRGAFTGADHATLGFYRAANGGTLLLDEIGELPLQSQAKLLRCIQEGIVTPLGATAGVAVDVRVIAATHRDLAAMAKAGTFREDLYYRLNVARLRLPPLRERKADIPLLLRHALQDFASMYQEPVREISPDAMAALLAHDWPGNVRELMNAIEHAMVFSRGSGPLRRDDLPREVLGQPEKIFGDLDLPVPPRESPLTLEAAERRAIEVALVAYGGNQLRAAKVLAVERHRLRRRIVYHGLQHLIRARG